MKQNTNKVIVQIYGRTEKDINIEYTTHDKLVAFLMDECVLDGVDDNGDDMDCAALAKKYPTIKALNKVMEECEVKELKNFKFIG